MTTPTPFLAWHAEAMRLANALIAAEVRKDRDGGLTAARAALSAHLLAVPLGDRPEPQKLPASLNACSELLRLAGKPYPRTCRECGLGPCKHRTQLDEQGRLTKPEGMA